MWRPPADLTKSDLVVVACTPHYFDENFVQPFALPEEWGTPVYCHFTSDLTRTHEADALWFHAPTITWLPKEKNPDQPWILMSMESDANYPLLKDNDFLSLFDIHVTYRLDSDIPAPYPTWREYGDFMAPPVPTPMKSREVALALYTASNPVRHRDNYVREFSKYVMVDSPGRCLNNKTIPGFNDGDNSWALNHLDQNDDAYEQHLAWKRQGHRDEFKNLVDLADIDPRHRMAVKLAHGCSKDCLCGGRIREIRHLPGSDSGQPN